MFSVHVIKQLESFIRDHIISYLFDNNLLSNRQYGIINGRSTSLQLLNIMDSWTSYLKYGDGETDVVYNDFERAFDKVPHRRLISKLESYGINTTIINWIRDFPKARKFRVRVYNNYSAWRDIIRGISIPQ